MRKGIIGLTALVMFLVLLPNVLAESWPMFQNDLARTGYTNNTAPDNVSQLLANYTVGATILSSPAVANGYVYVGSSDMKLYQLNANNVSQLIASYTMDGSVWSSPAVSNGYVYVGSHDAKFYQLNASNVSQLIASYTTGGSVQSSPAVSNGYVYVGSDDDKLYQLNASNVSQLIASYTTGGDVQSSPAIANGYVYVGSNDMNLYQLNASNVSQLIANYTTGDEVYSSPVVSNGYVYVGSIDGKLYQLNASNVSQLILSYDTSSSIRSSPAIANGYVYVGDSDGKFYQLNASNVSQLIASYTASGELQPSPAVANGYVYFGSNDYNIYQLNASNVSQLIANYTTGDEVYGSPAVANGYVYIGSYDYNLYQFGIFTDTTSPVITIYSPLNQSYTSVPIALNVDADETIDTWLYSIDGGANQTFTPNTTISPSDGLRHLEVYVNDTVGNWGYEDVWFMVDTVAPTITVSPPDNVSSKTQPYVMNVTTDEPVKNCTWKSQSSDNYTMTNTSNTSWSGDILPSASQGNFQIEFYCEDFAGNFGYNDSIWLIYDWTPPTLTINEPQNISYTFGDNLEWNVTFTDTYSTELNWSLSINNGSWTNLGVNSSTVGNTTPSTVGQYTWNFSGEDDAGNIGYADVTFTVISPTQTAFEQVPILAVIPIVIVAFLLMAMVGSIISGVLDLKVIITLGIAMMVAIIMVGIMYVV